MTESEPRGVARDDLAEPAGQQTSGMRRRQAFAGDDRWVGLVTTQPGDWSGWHHHGETDTYIYVLTGAVEFEYGEDRRRLAIGPGHFGYMPRGVVHRERNPSSGAGELVLVRIGEGPTVVNVEGPPG